MHFQPKPLTQFFAKVQIHYFWVIVGLNPQIWAEREFFRKIGLSFFFPYGPLNSCKKSEKSFEPIPRTCVAGGRTDGRTDVILLNRSAQRVADQYRLVSYFSHDNISFQNTTSLELNVRNSSCISILFQYICFKSIRIPFSEFKKMDKMTWKCMLGATMSLWRHHGTNLGKFR